VQRAIARNPVAVAKVWQLIDLTNRALMSSRESSEQIAEIFGLTYADYRQQLHAGESKDQTLLDYILSLRATYKTAMLSNVSVGGLARRFEPGELERYFDVVVASGDIGYAKPEAEAYEITADRLSVRLDECVFIDDREDYCAGAHAVGMQTIVYQSFAQCCAELKALLSQSAA